mgnify:CR=1 FL=1
MTKTIDKVKSIIANQLSTEVEKLNEKTNIAEELGADSLDLVEILMSLEDEFGISIPDEAIPNIKTIDDIVKFIDSHQK